MWSERRKARRWGKARVTVSLVLNLAGGGGGTLVTFGEAGLRDLDEYCRMSTYSSPSV